MKPGSRRALESFLKIKEARRAAEGLNEAARERKDERARKKSEGKAGAETKSPRTRRGEFGGPDVSNKATAYDLERAFRDATSERLGFKVVTSKWDAAELKLARKLLDAFGDELTFKAVKLIFERWGEYSWWSRDNLDENPTLRRLWQLRDRIFTAVQNEDQKNLDQGSRRTRMESSAPRRGKNSDEYRPMSRGLVDSLPVDERLPPRQTQGKSAAEVAEDDWDRMLAKPWREETSDHFRTVHCPSDSEEI